MSVEPNDGTMRARWFLVRRTAWTVVAGWLFLSATFFTLALTRDPNITALKWAAGGPEAQEAAVQAYLESRGRTGSLGERYLKWLRRYLTLDLGQSFVYDRPVTAVLTDRLPVTLGYLVPAIGVASVVSVLTGVFGAIRKGSASDRVTNWLSYAGLGVPAFFLGVLLIRHGGVPAYQPALGYFHPSNLTVLAAAAGVVGLNLYAVQSWAIRAEAVEIVPAEFVKTLRANGAGDRRVARHVLRNALAPVFALLVSELLVVVFVGVYVVELVFGLSGVAAASFRAFQDRDFALIIATVVLPVLVALVANLLLDVVSAYLDPRVASSE